MKRKIAAILAADIAGYSRLVAEDEEGTLRRLSTYRAVFNDFVARYGGRIFNTAGDAVLAEFQSAVDAIRCAVDVQESLRTRNLAYVPSQQMSYRIGITIGDVVERDGDLLGDGVNIASRLEAFAPTGGICISRSVHEATSKKISLKFDDLGLLQLKNIPDRVHAYTVALDKPERRRAASLTAWRVIGIAAVLLIAVLGIGVYWTSSDVGRASLQKVAVEQSKASVSQAASETPAAPAPVAADAGTSPHASRATPKDDPATAPSAAHAAPPAAERSPSSAPEKSAQVDQAEGTCRRYLPSIGKTVEVPCDEGTQAETTVAAPADVPEASGQPEAHAFVGIWSNSDSGCRNQGQRGNDRQIIFGVGAAQYLTLGDHFTCTHPKLASASSGSSFTATCASNPWDETGKGKFSSGDLTLNTSGEQLVGIGPDGYPLQLRKCN